ncbi:hypothetical protein EK21DRAFT_100124 [Setomelanomma holmii]|uniref:NYN domain-containing protein n=1 Tax=Setomelanomma holmii TaxID=210430 RepID=A0A9P4HB39_9PLEO|nr:hypothetical protein EK21DRAFT_100124 [Setomelanomma holmii]
MPSQPSESGWNFSPVFDLIDLDVHDIGSPTLHPNVTRPTVTLPEGGIGLGNFVKLFESLGFPPAELLPPLDESELSNSDDVLLPSPLLEAAQPPPNRADSPEPSSHDDASAGLTKKQRRKARRAVEREASRMAELETTTIDQQEANLKAHEGLQIAAASSVEDEKTPTKQTKRALSNVGAKIRPASPVPAPDTDRHMHLFEKLLLNFPDERRWLVAPRQLINENTTSEGIHVFVDASNIMIGFKDMLRKHSVQPYDMSFDSLALLMERRRPVAKRVSVGSHREANPLPHVTKLFETFKAVGYECNVQEQVYITREESEKKKFFNDVNKLGWSRAVQKRSGSGSDSETGAATPKTPSAPKWVEQGVDELLHLKMCQSLLDTEIPSTMVLATGDGAEAEMSDGFLAHVERALRKGWKVELVTWRQQTNGGYKRRAFRQKWGEQFTILELDDFLEDLVDTP